MSWGSAPASVPPCPPIPPISNPRSPHGGAFSSPQAPPDPATPTSSRRLGLPPDTRAAAPEAVLPRSGLRPPGPALLEKSRSPPPHLQPSAPAASETLRHRAPRAPRPRGAVCRPPAHPSPPQPRLRRQAPAAAALAKGREPSLPCHMLLTGWHLARRPRRGLAVRALSASTSRGSPLSLVAARRTAHPVGGGLSSWLRGA